MFVPDVGDIALKDGQKIMAFPMLYVGDYRGRVTPVTRLEFTGKNVHIEITAPPETGIATIRDYDIILFFISIIVERINQGDDVSKGIIVHAHSLLKFTRRGDGRKQYDMLEKALDRLVNTRISIHQFGVENEIRENTTWLTEYKFNRDPSSGRIGELTLYIPDWLYRNACQTSNVLTLHPDYFLLTPQARALYRIARKSAGSNIDGWAYSLDELYRRSGSTMLYRQWKHHLKNLFKEGPLLDYHVHWDSSTKGSEKLHFIKDEQLLELIEAASDQGHKWHSKIARNPDCHVWLSDEQKAVLKPSLPKR